MLIVTEFLTLDGVGQAPGRPDEDPSEGFQHGGWQAPLGDADVGDVIFEQARTMNALLLGRRTYEIFSNYWPSAPPQIPFTGLFNAVPKFVASTTLSSPLEWANSTVISDDVPAAVRALKTQFAELHVIGSLHLAQTLLRHGLVDRLSIWTYPVVLGSGKRLFEGGALPNTLRLVDAVTYPSGTIHARYDLADTPRYASMAT